jgi:hypothetical protein
MQKCNKSYMAGLGRGFFMFLGITAGFWLAKKDNSAKN